MPPFPATRHVLEPGCRRCPRLVASREHIAWGTGPGDADVVVVGEAPGAGDPEADRWRGGNWTGMAYTTRHSGRRVRELLESVGYLERSYFTNAVKCFPAASEDPSTNREPTDEELAACRSHLLAELEAVDPDVVVPTGRHATRSVFELDDRALDGFLETVLRPVNARQFGFAIVPLVHPSYEAVWIARLGHTRDSYRDALAALLDDHVG